MPLLPFLVCHCKQRRAKDGGVEPEARRLQRFEQGNGGRYHSLALGAKNDAKGAHTGDLEGVGTAPRRSVIQHRSPAFILMSIAEDLAFAGAEIPGKNIGIKRWLDNR